MLYGLYQSAVGADLQALKMDTISNNIANAGTTSFKRDLAIFAVRQQEAIEQGNPDQIPPGLEGHPGAAIAVESATIFSQGALRPTGAPLDAALMGPGFFKVSDGENEYLTRRGSFTLNRDSELVEVDTGYHVLDDRGSPITIPPGWDVQFQTDGKVIGTDPFTGIPTELARFDLLEPSDYRQLIKRGDSLYEAPEEILNPAGPKLQVRQGFQEDSTVRPVQEMLAMIETSRAFEANMNLIQHQENTLGQLLQAVGRD